jgi:hypothetical protein
MRQAGPPCNTAAAVAWAVPGPRPMSGWRASRCLMDLAAAAGLCPPWPGLRHRQACWVQQAAASVSHQAAWVRCSGGLLHLCHTGKALTSQLNSAVLGGMFLLGLQRFYCVCACACACGHLGISDAFTSSVAAHVVLRVFNHPSRVWCLLPCIIGYCGTRLPVPWTLQSCSAVGLRP